MKFAWMHDHREAYPVATMCRVLNVSRSGYYAWRDRPVSATARRRDQLADQIRQAHASSRRIYGSPRVHRELQAQGVSCCRNTVAKIMREDQLQSKMRRRFRPCATDSDHAYATAPNRLDQQFEVAGPNRVWAGDITYVATEEGWLYLAVVLDLHSRRVIGWAMADHLKASLAIDALTMAIDQRQASGDDLSTLLHHSDRGSQYASSPYRAVLAGHRITVSMSRRGNCYDNAVAESFFGSLKTEWTNHEHYATRQQAMQSLFEYIEVFYNRQRRHSSLGYVSPVDFEAA